MLGRKKPGAGLGREIRIAFEPAGVVCTFDVPVAQPVWARSNLSLGSLPRFGSNFADVSQGKPEMLGHLGRLDSCCESGPDRVALATVDRECLLLASSALCTPARSQTLQNDSSLFNRLAEIGPRLSALPGTHPAFKLLNQPSSPARQISIGQLSQLAW